MDLSRRRGESQETEPAAIRGRGIKSKGIAHGLKIQKIERTREARKKLGGRLRAFIVGFFLGLPFLYLSFVSTGGGHGNHTLAYLFIPHVWYVCAALHTDNLFVAMSIAMMVFPSYAVALHACKAWRTRFLVLAGIIVLHAVMFVGLYD